MIVSGTTQQRLVHRYQFEENTCAEEVSEISNDAIDKKNIKENAN